LLDYRFLVTGLNGVGIIHFHLPELKQY